MVAATLFLAVEAFAIFVPPELAGGGEACQQWRVSRRTCIGTLKATFHYSCFDKGFTNFEKTSITFYAPLVLLVS